LQDRGTLLATGQGLTVPNEEWMSRTAIAAVPIVVIACALVVAAVVAAAVGPIWFRSRYEVEKAHLLRSAKPLVAGPAQEPEALPAPVRRYLEVTRGAERPPLAFAIVEQRGALRTGAGKPWMPFDAEQVYTLDPPGFVWLAKARAAPLVSMLARDEFVAGKGNMLVTLLGALTMANARGPEMDLGAGLRYWGEIIAFPEALRSPALRWEALDARRARLAIEQGDLRMNAVVEFGPDGLPSAMHAERYRDASGTQVLTPWSGHMRNWKPVSGRLFPTGWESVWHLPEGDLSAVRMEILAVHTG
jgi:hypothetical protein